MYILQLVYIFIFIVMMMMYLNVLFSNTSEISKKLLLFLTSGLIMSLVFILQFFAKTIVEDKFFLNVVNTAFLIACYSEMQFAFEFNNLKINKHFNSLIIVITLVFSVAILTNNAHELVYGYQTIHNGNMHRALTIEKPLYYLFVLFLYSKIVLNFYVIFKNKQRHFTKKDRYFIVRSAFCAIVYTVVLIFFDELRWQHNIVAIIIVLDSLTLFYITNKFELKLDINKTKLYIVENIDMPIVIIMDGGKIIKHNLKAMEKFKALNNTEMASVYDLEEIISEDENFDIRNAKTVKIRIKGGDEKFFNVSIRQIKVNIFATYNLVVLQDTTNIKLIEKELEKMTSLDVLTNINNRQAFTKLAASTIEKRQFNNKNVALFMLDLDFFKAVNDNYGHIIGDEFLIATSEILCRVIKPFGHVGRYGGEEFCGVVTCDAVSEIDDILNVLRKEIANNYLQVKEGEKKSVTVSIGYVVCEDNYYNMELLFELADKALYHAKESGRNRVVAYSEEELGELIQ